ncbi:hypothetical protein CYY_000012 [Polysphondylium violaceum]|uniref:Large ribosomal subunit protein eL19 domain-containing protein n=1 Tax=Polysphondylium violaceum TaxID=133409 RepID=A0A8J4QBS3_9MYCE|nr:hypothetical protein CYY_000012 [Polysphondylium violaceum]
MLFNAKELAMRFMGVGWRKVWCDPTQMEKIKNTRTRAGIRELIAQGIIKRKFTERGSNKPKRGPFFIPKDSVFKLNNNHAGQQQPTSTN